MADTKISALTAASSALAADEFPVNEAGTTKKVTIGQVQVLMGNSLRSASTSSQSLSAATLTQLTGSSLAVPSGKLRIGTYFRWMFDITKTAAGTASSAYHVRIGTNNTTSDTAILTFTKPAGTGVADTGIIIITAIVRGPLSASCIMTGNFQLTHNLSSTGHATIPCVGINVVSSSFDATVANLFVSLSATTGASDAITIQCLTAEAYSL